jgi:hypothetical protein
MTPREPRAPGGSSKSPRGWLPPSASLVAAGALAAMSLGADFSASLPHVLFHGPPAGPASMQGGDWARSHHAESLGAPNFLSVVWRRRVASGISCNLLVDAEGRIFAAGLGSVTELTPDGRITYRAFADFSECSVAALLPDGSRVVLGAEGRLLSWSPRGTAELELTLNAPARFTHVTLLPLPDGGILATLGAWLFNVGSDGSLRSHAEAEHDVTQSLVAGGRVILVDVRGEISAWDGWSSPVRLGAFGASVSAIAASDPTTLVGIAGGTALAFSLEQGEVRALVSFDKSGVLPLISVPTRGRPIFLRSDGLIAQGHPDDSLLASPRAGSGQDTLRDAQLLGSGDGIAAWIAANVPLEIVGPGGAPQMLSEVQCAQPVSLVSAGPERLLAGCRSGQIWLIGPAAQSGAGDAGLQ